MLDSEDIGELAQSMWEEHQRETALEVDTSIVGVDCPACHMFLEEGHVCPDEDERLESSAQPVEYCDCGLPFGEGEHVCSTEPTVYDTEPDGYMFREDYPNTPRWPATALTDEQVAQQDCPLCPPDAGDKYKVERDFFGEICRIEGVPCCDTCYRVHHLTMSD